MRRWSDSCVQQICNVWHPGLTMRIRRRRSIDIYIRLALPVGRCVQQVERGAQIKCFCGCQEWLGAVDGSTRWIKPPVCSRTTQLKSHLFVALLVFPLNPITAVWSTDKLLVNKRYCNMCIDVPESTTAKCGPGDFCTFVCITIRQGCVYIRFSEESGYWLPLLIKDLVLMILISLCTAAQEWAAHLLNLCRLADAAVTSESMADLLKWTSRTYACSNLVWCTAFMVMMSTNCFICLLMREKRTRYFFWCRHWWSGLP